MILGKMQISGKAPNTLMNGLVGYYDTSQNSGYIRNNVTSTQTQLFNAYWFNPFYIFGDGSNQGNSLPIYDYVFDPHTPFSISFLIGIKGATLPGVIWGIRGAYTGHNLVEVYTDSNNQILFQVRRYGSSVSGGIGYNDMFGVHYVVTYGGYPDASNISVYTNGYPSYFNTYTNNYVTNDVPAYAVFGHIGTIGLEKFGVWNRVLTPLEAYNLYNNGNLLSYNQVIAP